MLPGHHSYSRSWRGLLEHLPASRFLEGLIGLRLNEAGPDSLSTLLIYFARFWQMIATPGYIRKYAAVICTLCKLCRLHWNANISKAWPGTL